MYLPLGLGGHFARRHHELLREDPAERLSRLAQPVCTSVRSRLEATLHALADRLDEQCQTPHALDGAYGRVSST